METINITSAAQLIGLASDPSMSVTATLPLLSESLRILDERHEAAFGAENPETMVAEFKRINGIAGVLAACEVVGAVGYDERILRAKREKLLGIARHTSTEASMLNLYRRFATPEQHKAVAAALNAGAYN